ncbi:aminoglycoside phosphotransferase family protein [Streptosporangium sp. NBC_01755]|uniref:phosphotransferase n=1 Tax=unclassified Streptosporangium TaxID=2632669 RepID=UPI002DD98749|nr:MULTISPECIES: phosphotransferase [unclassified Streptosporangium]WSA26642.1 aminoglycoside phosphotransferase family protein [Streptosporangium sp. NBC_01810]WSD01934.1 aminoglycoside phosphotransferase family protein [Streptosporangium sp. NBC_01755]
MIAVEDPRLTFARQALGPVSPVPMPGLPPHLLALVDARDVLHVVKRHTDAGRFRQEAHAYITVVPHLGDRAPKMVAADPVTRSLLLTLLSGQSAVDLPPGSSAERDAHHSAGATLWALHQVGPTESGDSVPVYLAERTRWWVGRAHAAGLISAPEWRTLLAHADALAVTAMEGAICHLDYQPRNWLVGPDGVVRVLDFEHARLDARVRDFARLEHRHWRFNPYLRQTFFDGYGRPPDETERDLLIRFGVIEALTALVRGRESGNPQLAVHGRTLLDQLI